MATKIVTKNSSTASAVPTASDLVQGELAVNVADKRLFTEDNAGAIVELGTNPSTLTVTGEITANGGIALGDNDKATFGAGDDLQIYHDGNHSYIQDAGTGNLYLAGDTNVGITNSSGTEWKVKGTTDGAVELYYNNTQRLATTSTGIDVTGNLTVDAGSNGKIEFGDITTNYGRLYADSTGTFVGSVTADPLIFRTTNTERMRIDSAGNLLVGKTSTDDGVNGFKVAPTGVVTSTVSSPSTNTYLVYSAGYKFYVNTDGGISNFSANNVNLSDEREKKNIEALPSQWDCLKHWDLKQFHYNADDDALPKKYGVIAQEIEAHCPEVIDVFNVDEDTERKGVKEQQMMWMAIKALQEAMDRIETLETRIAALEE